MSLYQSSPSAPKYHIQLLYGNGGGGHKASALAVQKSLQSSPLAPYLDVQLIDASAIAGGSLGDWFYNFLLSYNLITAIEIAHAALQNIIFPVIKPSLRQAFRNHFADTLSSSSNPSSFYCIVSFIPMLNAVIAEALPSSIPLLTVFTDFSHTNGHPWIQHPRQHLIAGTDIAVAQAISSGYTLDKYPSPSMNFTPTSGMVVHPKFYTSLSSSAKRRRRLDLGLPPDLPTVLILFGGTPPTERVLKLVDLFLSRHDLSTTTTNSNNTKRLDTKVNVIAICAMNHMLYDRLTNMKRKQGERRLFVTGFTSDIPLFMQISDVIIGKPGPGVVSEAFVSGLPSVLVTGVSESQVMKQERDVLDWVRRHGVGLVARTEEDAANVTLEQISDMRQNLAKMTPNQAVFEVRDIILKELFSDNNEENEKFIENEEEQDDEFDNASSMDEKEDVEMEFKSASSSSTTTEDGEIENDLDSTTVSEFSTPSSPEGLSNHPPSARDGLLHLLSSQSTNLNFRQSNIIHPSATRHHPLDKVADDEGSHVNTVDVW